MPTKKPDHDPDDDEVSLQDGFGWRSRAHLDPRALAPLFQSSEFYRKLSAPPSALKATAFCCWTDLLGFGQTLAETQWQPSDSVWKSLHERITEAHLCCFQSLDLAAETVFALNDGIVRCYDPAFVSEVTRVSMWLRECIYTHNWINDREASKNLPGARTLISSGEQLSFSHSEFRLSDFIFDSTKQSSHPDPEYEAFKSRPVVIHPIQLQLNLAFSRAYLLDQAGSRSGITGPHFYVDEAFIEDLASRALDAGLTVVDTEELNSRFFAIKSVREGYLHLGLRLQNPRITVKTARISTTVWRLSGYCPWDEPQPFGFSVL